MNTHLMFSIKPIHFELSTQVLIYNDGIIYKCVDLRYLHENNIIYDTFSEGDKYHDISITFCPYSYASVIYFGKFTLYPQDSDNTSNIIIVDDEGFQVQQLTGVNIDKSINKYYRRKDVIITTFRNSMSLYPDYEYLCYRGRRLLKPLPITIPEGDYKDVDPYKLIYGIEYTSRSTGKKKFTAVISKYSVQVNYSDSGYYNFFMNLMAKLVKRSAIITPCFWYAWNTYNPGSKIVYIK